MTPNRSLAPIMIVEDSPEDYEMVVRAFKQTGMKLPIQRFENGDDALDYLMRRGAYVKPKKAPLPAVIMVDLNLPGMSGKELLSAIKSDPSLKMIPTIVLTTSSASKDIEQSYLLGAAGYICKPIELKDLQDAIQSLSNYWLNTVQLPRKDSGA